MLVQIKVKPNSRNPRLEAAADGSLVAYLKSPPVKGKANAELVERLARHFGVAKAQVRIKSGHGGRVKLVEILGMDERP